MERSRQAKRGELIWLLEHPPVYYRRHQRRPAPNWSIRARSGRCRARRALYLSRAGPAGGLSGARPSTGAAKGRALLRPTRIEGWVNRGTLARFRSRKAGVAEGAPIWHL